MRGDGRFTASTLFCPVHHGDRAAGRELPTTIVPPGVDVDRFRPLTEVERVEARTHFGLPVDAQIIAGISRLVPRKGFDPAIRAVAMLSFRVR